MSKVGEDNVSNEKGSGILGVEISPNWYKELKKNVFEYMETAMQSPGREIETWRKNLSKKIIYIILWIIKFCQVDQELSKERHFQVERTSWQSQEGGRDQHVLGRVGNLTGNSVTTQDWKCRFDIWHERP